LSEAEPAEDGDHHEYEHASKQHTNRYVKPGVRSEMQIEILRSDHLDDLRNRNADGEFHHSDLEEQLDHLDLSLAVNKLD
jgi:hypothetical protein